MVWLVKYNLLHKFIALIASKDKLRSLVDNVNSVVRNKDEEIKQLKVTHQGLNYYSTILLHALEPPYLTP